MTMSSFCLAFEGEQSSGILSMWRRLAGRRQRFDPVPLKRKRPERMRDKRSEVTVRLRVVSHYLASGKRSSPSSMRRPCSTNRGSDTIADLATVSGRSAACLHASAARRAA